MTTTEVPLSDVARKTVTETLQQVLADLIDLGLLAKQAHWNVVGPNFRSLHLHLDELADLAREHSDSVAERMSAIGANPDGRASTIAAQSGLPQLGTGWLDDTVVVESVSGLLAFAVAGLRKGIEVTGEVDLVSQDLLIGIAADVEKQHWMFTAQRSR